MTYSGILTTASTAMVMPMLISLPLRVCPANTKTSQTRHGTTVTIQEHGNNAGAKSELTTGLGERLLQVMINFGVNHGRYVPCNEFDLLITEGTVKSELIRAGMQSEITTHLIRYILDHAKKIFAVLVMIDEPQWIKELVIEGMQDTDLPIGTEAIIRDEQVHHIVCSFYPDSETLDKRHSWATLQGKRLLAVDRFCSYQWRFLAPVFTSGSYKYFLHPDCPLPFIHLEPKAGVTKFNHHSKVFKVYIHKAHVQWVS
jgi:hypothetical protein